MANRSCVVPGLAGSNGAYLTIAGVGNGVWQIADAAIWASHSGL